jgi:carbonic anhydrase/acetyltransferase-like protein (isoleucine patch superfamily)
MPIYALGEHEPRIDSEAFVHPDAVVIGNVTIGAYSTIWPCAVLRGDAGPITVGARTSIQDGAVIHVTESEPTVIGSDCVIGHQVHMEGCTIEDGVLVGSGSKVLANACVRAGALVGANAVVTQGMEVPARAMALGVPARVRLDAVDPALIAAGAEIYVARGAQYRASMRRIG